MPAERVNGKWDGSIVIQATNLLFFQINLKLGTDLCILRKFATLFLRYSYGQHAILHRIIPEDVCETGRDDAVDTKIFPLWRKCHQSCKRTEKANIYKLQAACSRELPQPKFEPVQIRIFA